MYPRLPSRLQFILLALCILGTVSSQMLASLAIGIYTAVGLLLYLARMLWPPTSAMREKHAWFQRLLAYHPAEKKQMLPFLLLTLPFLIHLFGGFYTENLGNYYNDLKIRLPLLLMPLAALSFPALDKKQYLALLSLLVLFATLSVTYPLYQLAFGNQDVLYDLSRGKHIAMHLNHIRYTTTLALAGIAALYLFLDKRTVLYKWERPLYFIAAVILIIVLHLFAVRTGLASLYLGLFILLISRFRKGSLQNNLWLVSGIVALLVLLFVFVPTLREKMSYMRSDITHYLSGEARISYSDTERILSWEIACKSMEGHWLLGHGSGDEYNAMLEEYAETYPENKSKQVVHNQYLLVLMENGLLGLFLFSISMAFLLLHSRWKTHLLNTIFVLSFFFGFLVENTIDAALGMAMFLLWVVLGLQLWRGDAEF